MGPLTDDEARAVGSWLDRHQFEKASSIEEGTARFGDTQVVWERDGTLVRLTRDRGQWWCDLSRRSAAAWLDIDAVAGAMGSKSSPPVDRVADVAESIDDRVFSEFGTVIRRSP
jgi:hypothetical protein